MKLDLIGIYVEDTQRSLSFYRKLGWEIPAVPDSEKHVEITLQNGLRFSWDELAMMKTFDPEAKIAADLVGVFLFEDKHQVDAKYLEVTNAGYVGHLPPADAPWGQRYAIVKDPDGHKIGLSASL
jgi:catechol 2,3-dioxygenase-like lactoylglutathione lyase family enzyme